MNMRAVVIGLLVGCLPAGITAQQTEDPLQRVFARAAEMELPVSLLESKVAEGRAKGIPESRILAAVEQRLNSLDRARSAIRQGEDPVGLDALDVGADALQAGIGEAVLRELAASTPAEGRAVAIATLTQLVQLGEAPPQALRQVQSAVARGPEALANLPARAAEARLRRGPPEGAGTRGPPDRAGPPSSVPGRGGGPPGRGNPNDRGGGPPGGSL